MEEELASLFNQYQVATNWALVGIVTILLALLIRHLLVHRTLSSLKHVNKEIYKAVTKNYLKKSIFGWIFFGIGVVIVELLWFRRLPLISYLGEGGWLILTLLSFLFGTYLHLSGYINSVVEVLRERLSVEKAE